MKKLIIIPLLLLCLSVITGTSAFSQQGKNKGAAKKTEKLAKPAKSESTDLEEQKVIKQAKEHDVEENEHHPATQEAEHGKKVGQNPDELTATIQKGHEKALEARAKINDARQKLEKDKKAGKISDADYKVKKDKIEKAEKAVDELEKNVDEGKDLQQPVAEPSESKQ